MFCSQCGYMLDENDKFCPKCGTPVKPGRTDCGPEYETDSDYHHEPEDKKRQKRRAAQRQKKRLMILCGGVAALAFILIVILVGYSFYKNYRMDGLKQAYTAYEQTMDDYKIEDDVYKELLARAQKAIENKDISSAKRLEKELNEACKTIEANSESRQKLAELKTEYETIFSKYRISGDYKEAYDTVMKALDDAISASDEKQMSTLKKQLESLKINLNTQNQQEVTEIKNEITAFDVSDADTEDAKLLEDYKSQVEAALSEKDYAAALDVLEIWREDAKSISEKIKKEREAKAESMKAEQERLESESESRAEESRKAESEKEASASGDYILPDSNKRLLTDDDLEGLSANELMLARNEIYARHGRKFVDEQIQTYFDSKSWYKGTVEAAAFDTSVLSDIERKNISFIGEHE